MPQSPSWPEEPAPEPGWDVGRCCRIIQKKLIHFFPFALLFFFSYCHFHLGLFFKTNTRTHRGWSCSLLGFHFKCNLVLKSIFPFGLEKTTIVSLVTCSPIIPEQMPSKKFCSYCRKTADKMLHNHHYCKNCGKSG